MVAAESETITRVFTRGIYHVLANTETLERLKHRAKAVMPDRNEIPPLERRNELLYLFAAVEEVLCISARIHTASRSKLPRS